MATTDTDAAARYAEFGRILEESLNEIYIFDATTLRFLQVNRGARANLGYSMDELKTLTPIDIKPEYSREAFERLISPLRSDSQPRLQFETRHTRKDGTCYDVDVHLQLLSFQGKPAFVAIILDTTEQHHTEADLRLRTRVLEEAVVGMVITDTTAEDNPIVYCNPAFERITGYAASEVIGRNCRFLQADDRNQPAVREVREAVRQGQRHRALLRNYRKDGKPFWNELTITPVRDASGRVTNFIGAVHDVTAQRLAEEQGFDNEARLAAVLDNAVEAIITIDERGACESVNKAAERMFGYHADELIGQNVSVLMPPPYRETHDSYLANYLRTGEKKIIGIGREVTGLRRDGSEFPLKLSVSEVRLGARRTFTGILYDLSEQKEYERRLIQSERLAAVGEAMASVAHESRNLLQRIQTNVELSRLSAEGDEALDAQLNSIERASDGLYSLLEEVRDYAAPLKLTPSEHLLQEVLEEAWQGALQPQPEREATLHLAPGSRVRVVVDRFRMVQVFRNLFENAIAAGVGRPVVEVTVTETHTQDERLLSIVVRDNGPGLTDEQQERVFDPFFTTKSKGTGLGMAIAAKILHAHGGAIRAGGVAGEGAEFQVELPQ